MSHRHVSLKLIPAGLVLDRLEIGVTGITVHAHSASPTSYCPACGLASSSVHSRYERSIGDLPAHGRRLGTRLSARRFRCRNTACERRVFTERFAPNLIQAHARRTSRLPKATSDMLALVRAATWAVRRTWRDGYRYGKAGMVTVDLVPLDALQRALPGLGQFDRERSAAFMAAVDARNRRFGRGTVVSASAGTVAARAWSTRCDRRSPRYTTRVSELPVVRAV